MADFEPKDGWRRMLCVEAGSVGEWVKLDGGEAWEGRVGVKLVEEG
jgi:glucose-6-phosphate 1-epimerase